MSVYPVSWFLLVTHKTTNGRKVADSTQRILIWPLYHKPLSLTQRSFNLQPFFPTSLNFSHFSPTFNIFVVSFDIDLLILERLVF